MVQPHRRLLRETCLTVDRIVKRSTVKSSSSGSSSSGTIAVLKETIVDREFVFFLFNDIMIQCKLLLSPGTLLSASSLFNTSHSSSSSTISSTFDGTTASTLTSTDTTIPSTSTDVTPSSSSSFTSTSLTSVQAAQLPPDAGLELVRTLRFNTRHRPASVLRQTWASSMAPWLPLGDRERVVLRLVDDEGVLYVRGAPVEELELVCKLINEARLQQQQQQQCHHPTKSTKQG